MMTLFCCAVLPASAKLNNVVLERISVDEGLSQATVNVVAQDQQGYIWIGTDNGVNIYDGYRVSQLPGPDNDFYKYAVSVINVSKNGLVWIGLLGKGLYTYNPKNNEYQLILKHDPQDKDLSIWQVLEDNDNNAFWVVTEKSLLRFDLTSKSLSLRIDLTPYLPGVNTLYRLSLLNERLFLLMRNGLFVYDLALKKLIKLPEIRQADIANVYFNEAESTKKFDLVQVDNTYYIGTNDGVFSFSEADLSGFLSGNTPRFVYQSVIANVAVWQLVSLNNTLYAATTEGLYRFDIENQQSHFLFKFGEHFKFIADANITTILPDHNGQLWLGSTGSGVYIWTPSAETVNTFVFDNANENSLSSGNISAIVSIDDTDLWVGTENGLNFIDIETNDTSRFLVDNHSKTSYTQSNIYEIEQDYLGRLWLSTAVGVVLFDTVSKSIIETEFPAATKKLLKANDTWVTIESIGHYIWLVADDGIYKIHASTGQLEYLDGLPENFNNKYVWHVMKSFSDDPNDILISMTDTLWQFNQTTNELTKVFHKAGLPQDGYSLIDHWARDSKGTIWLSFAQVGLLAINPNTYDVKHFFDEHNSILDTNIYGVQVDSEDNVWVSSHAGIFRVRALDHHMRRFNIIDGLASTEFNAGAFYQFKDGRFAYGGVAGVSLFDPLKLASTGIHDANTVSIVNVDTLSRPLNTPHILPNNYSVNLEHDDFGIRIDFSNFVYGSSEKPIYQYSFVGGVAFPETRQNFAIFPQLDSGQHTFRVAAKSVITGQWSAPTFIRLNVAYAPWKSPLAITLYIIAALVIIAVWFHSRRLRQKELLKAHKEVKYRENRLQLALSGSNSDVWDWQSRNNLLFAKRFVQELGYPDESLAIDFRKHIDLIHMEDKGRFARKWQSFIASADSGESFECTYRLKAYDGSWLWYRDLGKVVGFDNDGLPSRVTGSYTNITESKATQERAQYYGAVFEQTHDWVLIFDKDLEVGLANKSMAKAFGWTSDEFKLANGLRGIENERIEHYRNILPGVLKNGHWRGEELITTPNGEKYHVITNITASINVEQNKTHFICVYTDITAQKSAENELRIMANYDHLTGLPNRALLIERIQHAITSSQRRKDSMALFFVDLDRFKQINDSLGHECGDLLLKEVARRLKASSRADDTIARIGGDEFVVLLEKFSSNNEIAHIAQKFIDIIQSPITLSNNVVSIGASIGISIFPEDADDSESLFRNADVAMYHAKQHGRNNYQFFTEFMNQEAKQRLKKESGLKMAAANNEFFNVYQPIIDAHTGKSVGVELLMRWEHAGQLIPPVDFIPLAEELGLIIPMTEAAIERGFAQLSLWRKERKNFYLSVNFSAKHFSDKSLIASIKRQLAAFNLPANALKIEITENAFIKEPEKAIEVMQALSDMGVLLALDDFGTGFSSLTYLKKLPLDIIKIDRSFVDGIGKENTDEAIIEATLVLAKSLNMYCIAEGVETEAQLHYLSQRKCHYIQGYLYSKPLPADELMAKIKQNADEIIVTQTGSDAAYR